MEEKDLELMSPDLRLKALQEFIDKAKKEISDKENSLKNIAKTDIESNKLESIIEKLRKEVESKKKELENAQALAKKTLQEVEVLEQKAAFDAVRKEPETKKEEAQGKIYEAKPILPIPKIDESKNQSSLEKLLEGSQPAQKKEDERKDYKPANNSYNAKSSYESSSVYDARNQRDFYEKRKEDVQKEKKARSLMTASEKMEESYSDSNTNSAYKK